MYVIPPRANKTKKSGNEKQTIVDDEEKRRKKRELKERKNTIITKGLGNFQIRHNPFYPIFRVQRNKIV